MGIKSNYNNYIYKMYEESLNKIDELTSEIRYIKLENKLLVDENNRLKSINDNKIKIMAEKITNYIIEENKNLKYELSKANAEIERLKSYIADTTNRNDELYIIDKLTNQVNKDSTNSGISTSKEIRKKVKRTNTYNHREKSVKSSGAQPNHIGKTLTKDKIEQQIKENKLDVKTITHYVSGDKQTSVKYKVGLEIKPYVEKHIFIYGKNYKNNVPKEFYSDVTYSNDIKTIITMLGNYCSLSFVKIQELISFLSNGIINISEGSIDNFYNACSVNSEPTLNNITNNILNGKYQHTDETVTSENGKDTYYRGYANSTNVLYKYHHHKGDNPIQEDNILTNYYGTIISDHDTGVFKYGTNNQDCIVHIGRYCKEGYQNIYETS